MPIRKHLMLREMMGQKQKHERTTIVLAEKRAGKGNITPLPPKSYSESLKNERE